MIDRRFGVVGRWASFPDAGACPDCGDSIQRVAVQVPDHGTLRLLHLAWCMDCRDVKATALEVPEFAKVALGTRECPGCLRAVNSAQRSCGSCGWEFSAREGE